MKSIVCNLLLYDIPALRYRENRNQRLQNLDELANPLISVICIFAMSICRLSFTLLQSSVSRRPCRLPVRWWCVPTNGNRVRRLWPRPALWVPVPSKAIPATIRKSPPRYRRKDRYTPRRSCLHGWVPRPPRLPIKHMQIRNAFCPWLSIHIFKFYIRQGAGLWSVTLFMGSIYAIL